MLGNAVFVNLLRTSRLRQLKVLFLCRSLLRTDAERVRPHTLETSSNWTIAKVFFKKVTRFVTCYGKIAARMFWKLLNIVLSRAFVWETRELMVAGGGYCCGPPQINERMGNTGGCLWECRQFSSTQKEPYETCRARGDCPIVNRSPMVSLSWADKKSVRDNNSNKK